MALAAPDDRAKHVREAARGFERAMLVDQPPPKGPEWLAELRDEPVRDLSQRLRLAREPRQKVPVADRALAEAQAGGPDAPITAHFPTPAAGTYLGFQELALEKRPYREDAVQHASYAEIARAVSEDRNAIGFVAMSMTPHLPVRAVTINGVAPTSIAVSDDLYPFARMLRFYTAKGRETPAALEFIRYVRSTEGQNVLEQAGFVRRFQRRLSLGMETP